MDYLYSEHLMNIAYRYYLPLPLPEEEHEDKWMSLDFTIQQVLSYDARRELISAIIAARKERSEPIRLWLASLAPIITAIAGLVGVIIGFYLGRK